MRVAFVSIEDPANVRAWSGTTYFMLDALRKAGIEVKVIAPLSQNAKYWLAPVKLAGRLRGQGLHLDRRPLVLKSYALQVEKKLAADPCDAILSPSSIPIALLPPGLPVVFWTDAVFDAMRGYSSGAFQNYSRSDAAFGHQQEDAALHPASFAVYSSDWAAESARKYHRVSAEKVKVVRFGANLPVEHGEREVQSWMERRLQQKCRLLLIGVNWQQKGGPIAMEATRILRERGIDAALTVAGCDAPASPYVESVGFVSKATKEGRLKISQLLREASFFILPTRTEAAGIVFCEASAFGLPCLATSTGGVGSYVRNGVNGYCLPYKATAVDYADQIQTLLNDLNLYRKLSLGAYQEFATALNWDTAISRVIELLQMAIHQSSNSGSALDHACRQADS